MQTDPPHTNTILDLIVALLTQELALIVIDRRVVTSSAGEAIPGGESAIPAREPAPVAGATDPLVRAC